MIAFTVIVNAEAASNEPSLTVKVNVVAPFIFKSGVIVAVQFGAVPENTTPETGISAVLEVESVIDVLQFKVLSISVIVKVTGNAVSSFVVCGAIAKITGASFCAVTVCVNKALAVRAPSETVNVKSAVPF